MNWKETEQERGKQNKHFVFGSDQCFYRRTESVRGGLRSVLGGRKLEMKLDAYEYLDRDGAMRVRPYMYNCTRLNARSNVVSTIMLIDVCIRKLDRLLFVWKRDCASDILYLP